MATITLKNVPKELHAKLTKRAAAHRRSLNQEAIACLEEKLQVSEPVPGHVWDERFRKIREKVKVEPLTQDFLKWAIEDGRE
jgi:plasmid stability protein